MRVYVIHWWMAIKVILLYLTRFGAPKRKTGAPAFSGAPAFGITMAAMLAPQQTNARYRPW
jgi:hypothetical protein